MSDFNRYSKGTEWRRWDLHIHAPSSALNNNFEGSTEEEKWNNYFKKLSSLEGIAVLGITDYFSIEGYKKVIEEKNNGNLPNIDLILPNLEMRIIPVTSSETPINIHIIFSPEIVNQLETYFFSELEYEYQGIRYKCTREGLIRLGMAYKNDSQLTEKSAYIAGVEQFKITIKDIDNIFLKHRFIKDNSVVLVSNSNNDGNSGIQHCSLATTRENIYRFADFIFSSNPKDRDYFLGKRSDNESEICRKFYRLKPCVHGSDAHCLEKICKPDLDRYTWVKADPTFNGLRQLIYEPESRVIVQKEKPQEKTNYLVVDKVRFVDNTSISLFSNEWIELNSNMNAIIGGKSSGKSLLSYYIAKTVDPCQIEGLSKNNNLKEYNFGYGTDKLDFEVVWKDGIKNCLSQNQEEKKRQITYIPQLYINKLAEEKNAESLDKLILEILLQNSEFSVFYKQHLRNIEEKEKLIGTNINELFVQLSTLNNHCDELRKLGDKNAVINEIDNTSLRIKELIEKSNLTEEENKTFNELDKNIKNANIDILRYKSILEQIINLRDFINSSTEDFIKSIDSKGIEINSILGEDPEGKEIINDIISNYLNLIYEDTKNYVIDKFTVINQLEDTIKSLGTEVNSTTEKLKPYVEKLKDKELLNDLESHLKEQSNLLTSILDKETVIKNIEDKIRTIMNQTLEQYEGIYDNYKNLKDEISKDTYKNITQDIQLLVDLKYDCEKFAEKFMDLFNRTSSFKFVCEFIDQDKKFLFRESEFLDDIKSLFNILLDEKSNNLVLKANKDKKTAAYMLFGDYFNLKYYLVKDGDPIYNMSPGKQGLVLLQLFLHLSNAKHPIIIDQPEDNLDNRTISSELVDFIKSKKIDRQIILVTHNANIVILGDAEEVIIANQSGQLVNRDNAHYRFEYVSGSIENSFDNPKGEGILYKKGIKEHVCEILEGGEDAFRTREDRYGFI